MTTVSVTNVKKSGSRFDADVKVIDYPENERSFHAHTNRNGCGLWTGDAQVYGTSQFSVRTKAAFSAALRRAFQ